MNKDAISKQNSAAMVEQLATMSQQRQKVIARHFASFVKHLFHEIYRLVVENEDQNKVIEIAGGYVQVNPQSWKEKRDVVVELKLGYGEAEREAQKRLSLHSLFSQDPTLQPMYSMENRYALMKEVFLSSQGILNVEEYYKHHLRCFHLHSPNPASTNATADGYEADGNTGTPDSSSWTEGDDRRRDSSCKRLSLMHRRRSLACNPV